MRPTTSPEPRRHPRAGDRRRVGRVIALWAELTLGGLALLTALIAWHLVRRGRILRDRVAKGRPVDWPELPEKPRRPEPS